jgi:hypothetical protein
LFVQAGYKIPLNLVSQQEEFRLQRPQEPKPPFPYKMEEVGVNNRQDTLELAGTLTLPEGPGPFPAIVLVTGSGAQNRDEEIFGHKPFLLLADRLTAAPGNRPALMERPLPLISQATRWLRSVFSRE